MGNRLLIYRYDPITFSWNECNESNKTKKKINSFIRQNNIKVGSHTAPGILKRDILKVVPQLSKNKSLENGKATNVSALQGTPWNKEFIHKDDDDPRRHKARCYYHRTSGICGAGRSPSYLMHCNSLSLCDYYRE